ncbi:response regulator [Actinomadura verrucosospora]|uniref:Two component system response regulator n=1 Tax=Actinomadura verrucosospora TaxID=46165 RepID=A0A7D3VU82_ACTVE|nr:response regulator transcription factor [Actinomadura verrucosospora]QKG23220.1 two component system response regulator [Actinomadura verrucosospora]
MTIGVLVADDQDLVRTGTALVVDSQPDMRVVGQAADGAAAVRLAAGADVVLMDVRMPVMDGVEATREICRAGGARVLVLTTFDLDEYAFAALRAGASGFLLKDAPAEEMLAAIRTVHRGDAVIAPSTTRRLLDHVAPGLPASASPDPLTDREREVLLHLALGLSNAEIAARLFMAEGTVKTHVGRILAKLGVRDRVQAVIWAYDHRLVRPV